MLGFGFVLFLMLVMLAVIYSQFAMLKQPNPAEMMTRPEASDDRGKMMAPIATPLPAAVTPDTASDDLIDEALTDRDDLSSDVEEELTALEEGN